MQKISPFYQFIHDIQQILESQDLTGHAQNITRQINKVMLVSNLLECNASSATLKILKSKHIFAIHTQSCKTTCESVSLHLLTISYHFL